MLGILPMDALNGEVDLLDIGYKFNDVNNRIVILI